MINGHAILSDVPTNITCTTTLGSNGLFAGFNEDEPRARHVIPWKNVVLELWTSLVGAQETFIYLKVEFTDVSEGVKGLVENGIPSGLVLIDDGWQSICHDDEPITDQEATNRTSAGEQMPCRLIKHEENYEFREYVSPKEEFKTIEHVYVWHAFMGYWGGVRHNVPGLPEAQVINPELSPDLELTMEDLAVDKIVNNRVGLV